MATPADTNLNEAVLPEVIPKHISAQNARDNEELLRLGRKPVLERFLGLFSTAGLVSIITLVWQSALLLLSFNLFDGDIQRPLYAFPVVAIGVVASAATLGELVSIAPTAGGQQHWVSILAPRKARAFLGYTAGWMTTIGWQAATAALSLMATHVAQALLLMTRPGHQIRLWQTAGIYLGLVGFATIFGTFGSSFTSPAKGPNTILEILSIAALIFTPVCCYPGNGFDWGDKILILSAPLWSIESVPTRFKVLGFAASALIRSYLTSCGIAPTGVSKATDYITSVIGQGAGSLQGILLLASLAGPAFSLLGADAPVHLAEETLNPASAIPRAILLGSSVNTITGLAMLAAASFGIRELSTVSLSPSVFAFKTVFEEAVAVRGGVVLVAFVVGLLCIVSVYGSMMVASRALWSFARDQGIGGWKWIGNTDSTYDLPRSAVLVTFAVSTSLGLLSAAGLRFLGSTDALSVIVSLTVGGLYTSYLLSASLLLYRRVTGHISAPQTSKRTLVNTTGAKKVTWGPWRIPEPFGTLTNLLSVVYLLVTLVMAFSPVLRLQSASILNPGSLALGSTILSVAASYFIIGRKDYSGPIVQVKP